MVNNVQNPNICTQCVKNPYVCPPIPQSNIVIPQGQIAIPQVPVQPLQIITNPPVNNQNAVNYNQISPYINTGTSVFQPAIQTKTGQLIANTPVISTPIVNNEAQIVYQGPIKNVNPQITPVEQSDAQIEKDFQTYFQTKAQENEELKSALDKTFNSRKKKKIPFLAQLLGGIIIIGGAYKYRTKIPFIKKFFK